MKTVMSNPTGKFNYFGWPTIARLKDGRLAVCASGFRMRHICPFGKACISYSDDEGETFTLPAPVIDTPLDDRDGGITPFGESGAIVTSFNNTTGFQRINARFTLAYAYLDTVSDEDEEKYVASNFRISYDNGKTFGPIYKSPVTSPHGPIELSDGTILYVGRNFQKDNARGKDDGVSAYRLNLDGTMELLGRIELEGHFEGEKEIFCEPHAIELSDGRILLHIRTHTYTGVLTIYQTISCDGGRTWEKPYPIAESDEGAPPHLMRHSSGVIVCSYAKRVAPFEVKAMFSFDEGKTWEKKTILTTNGCNDFGYASTVELKDGSMLTVFYMASEKGKPTNVYSQRWSFDVEG